MYIRSDQAVQLKGPIGSIGEHDIFCRKVVATRHIESAARVGQDTLLECITQCRCHIGLVIRFRTVVHDVADLRFFRERSCGTNRASQLSKHAERSCKAGKKKWFRDDHLDQDLGGVGGSRPQRPGSVGDLL